MKKIIFLLTAIIAVSCTQTPTKKLSDIESFMLDYPDSALALLKRDSSSICNEGEYNQYYYKILLCRIKDLLYMPYSNKEEMTHVAQYFHNIGNKRALSMAYYCLGCINREQNQHPRAIKYFLKAITTDSINTPKEMIGRCYCQLAGLEENRMNISQALTYNKAAYLYAFAAKDHKISNACLIDIAHNYHAMGKQTAYTKYINMAKTNIIKQHDSTNLSRLIITEGQIAVLENNQNKLQEIINDANNSLTTEETHKWDFCLIMGYYYQNIQQLDSAYYYFQKVLNKDGIAGKYSASMGLAKNKAKEKDYHGAWHYLKKADWYRNIEDSINNKSEAEKMKVAFNYDEEIEKREEAEEATFYSKIGFLVAICCILGLSTFILFFKNSSKKKELQQLEIIAQQNKEIEKQKTLILNQNEDIQKLENRNNDLSKYELLSEEIRNNNIVEQIKLQNDKWNQFRMSEAYTQLQNMVKEGLKNHKGTDYQQAIDAIEKEIDMQFHNYGKRLKATFPEINDLHIMFAYLVKADVKFSNIAILLNKSKSSITKISRKFSLLLNKPYIKEDIEKFLQNF